jgi:hypothetical protein
MTGVFSKYIGTPYQPHIRPAIPPGATLAPNCKVEPEKRGKVPGLWSGKDWIGLPGVFQDKAASSSSLAGWDKWPTENVALRTGDKFNGVDIDTEDGGLAAALRATAERILGPAPVRGRPGSARCLLAYRLAEGAEPIRKRTLAWRMPGEDPGAPPTHQLELLGAGGHMMIEGVHPSGARYAYCDGKDLIAWGADNLASVDEAAIETFFAEAEALIATAGGMIARRSVGGPSATPGGRRVIGDPAHLAPSTEAAIRALHAIPCDELDYDDWIRVTAAFKAATGGADDAHDAYIDWSRAYPDNTDEVAKGKWESVRDSALGAAWLVAKAAEWGFNEAIALFEPLTDDEDAVGRQAANQIAGPDDPVADGKALFERWEDRYAYVEPMKEFVDLRSPTLQRYDLQAFKLKFPMFTPWSVNTNAVIRYLQGVRKTVCDGYTYLPGKPRIVRDGGRRLVNRWSPGLAVLDRVVSEEEVQVWLSHLDYIIPNPLERETVLNWLAHLVQRRSPKVNYALLLGGKQGIGKSLLFDPIIRVLGQRNARTTSEVEIKDKFTGWVAEKELVMLEEIRGLPDEVLNRLKMYIAAPPHFVPINEKHVKPYEVPNVARFVAFTNSEYALQLADDDRRWFVVWSPALPKPPGYYVDLARWSAENAALVGTWLAQRDLSGFAAQDRAPMTTAKREMQLAGRNSLDYWVCEAIANGRAPFETDLVSVDDVLQRLPYEVLRLKPAPTEKSIGMALKSAGAVKLDRVSLGRVLETTGTNRTVLWGIRGQGILRDLCHEKLVDLFWRQRDERVPRPPRFHNLDEPEAKAG